MQPNTMAKLASKRPVQKSKPPVVAASRVSKTVTRQRPVASISGLLPIEVKVEFKLKVPGARVVSVAGTFNNWNPQLTPLLPGGDEWSAVVALPRGLYEYRFVVDGQWVADPAAIESIPNPFGGHNSLLTV
jgi:1,4-alpha-glucan branching enzyme